MKLIAGFVAAVAVAMALAVALALAARRAPAAGAVIEQRLLLVLNSFPSVGWAILGVVWFQVSNATVVFIEVAIVLPFCLINALEGFRQIDADLEEMGRSLSRSRVRLFARVTLPLVVPAFFAGLGVVFIRSMTAISATIFLVSIDWMLITVRILENMTELSLGPAAAFSVFVIVVVLAVVSLLDRLMLRMRGSAEVTLTGLGGG